MPNTNAFDWFWHLTKARQRAVSAAIKVLVRAGYGTPEECLIALQERDNARLGRALNSTDPYVPAYLR